MMMKCGIFSVLYADDSVEVQYSDGSSLQLSPCGSEFWIEKALPASAHPMQQPERIRQRTQYAISNYKDQVLQALEFRNRFSVCPYLPSSMLPPDRISNVFTSVSFAKWPISKEGRMERLENGSLKVSSVDGHASLYLSKLQQEFTVEFLCRISQKSLLPASQKDNRSENTHCSGPRSRLDSTPKETTSKNTEHEITSGTVGEITKKDSLHSVEVTDLFPEMFAKKANQYTWVVQQYSVSCCPEEWKYPLSLAIDYCNLQTVSKSELRDEDDRSKACPVLEEYEEKSKISFLPKALPISCNAPHLHRWSFFDLISQRTKDNEHYSRPGLIKVVLCNEILYRFIHGPGQTVEIYPGDGTYLISQGSSFGKYFTHYLVRKAFGKKEAIMYAVANLPPDTPDCRYSVRTLITQATRILEHCFKAELCLNHSYEICCWMVVSQTLEATAQPIVFKQTIINDVGRFSAYSDNRVIADFFDGITLHMIWKFLYNQKMQSLDKAVLTSTSQIHQNTPTGWCQVLFPAGGHQLLQIEFAGPFQSYVNAVVTWCKGLDTSLQKESPLERTEENWSVFAELAKIQRFNFLLENSNVSGNHSDLKTVEHKDPDRRSVLDDSPSDMDENRICEVLEKTAKAILDIDLLLSSSSRK